MKSPYTFPFLTSSLFFAILAFTFGCVSQDAYVKKSTGSTYTKEAPENINAPRETEDKASKAWQSVHSPQDEKAGKTPVQSAEKKAPQPGKPASENRLSGNGHDEAETVDEPTDMSEQSKSDQEMLDSALEFCQASYDYWGQGDLENSIDSLDQAYSLILKVKPDHNPELLQQREDLRVTIAKRIIEVYASRFTVANGCHKAIPLVMNNHVQSALDLLKGREKKFFMYAYKRSGRYRPAIVRALKEAGLPEELSWLPLIESGFKVRALSRARALGLWQFIASTGYKFGLKRDTWVDERMDPEKSTKAAIDYLKELHQIFGDWATVLAAYNCGEGTVLRKIKTQKVNYLDNFWDLYTKLPSETAFYVPKFLAVLHILNDPKAHGFELPPVDDEIVADKVTIDRQVHLKTVAKHVDVSYDTLKELNAELRRYSTPGRPYTLNIPKGKGDILLAKMDEIPTWTPPVPSQVRHRVRKGETLSTIACRYGTSVRAIMNINGLKSRNYIKVGWSLKVPTKKAYASTVTRPSLKRGKDNTSLYVVRKGDSLWKIARRFGTTTQTIQAFNHLGSSNLSIGQALIISRESQVSKEIASTQYRVKRGDSPYVIARRHQMNLSEFLRLNRLTPRSRIYPGQMLLVKAD